MAWTRGSEIGKGSTAAVYTAVHGGDIIAVKTAKFSKSRFLQREEKILSKLSSPHVVGFKGFDVRVERNELYYNLFMEYIAGGTLVEEIRRQGGRLDEQSICNYTCQILKGVEYLHSNGVTHCDIKCSNILINGEQRLKLADFGCSKTASDCKQNASNDAAFISGTPIYMAPETARGEEQGYEADVWAIGCAVIEMATGKLPWTDCGSDPVRILYRIGFSDEVPAFPSSFSEQGNDFLSKCLVRDPKQRWTVKELLTHPFVKKIESLENPNSISPTSVLTDHQIWSNSDDDDNKSQMEMDSDGIEELAGVSGRPDWSCFNEDWIQVRSESGSISEIECLDENADCCVDDVIDDLGMRCRYDCSSFSSRNLMVML